MNYAELLQAARGQMGPCRACPVCNGRACGQGLAIMPELMFRRGTDHSGCQVLRLEPAAKRSIGLACLSRGGLSPAAKQFVASAQEYATTLK